MESMEQMGVPPKQPKEELVVDKEKAPGKPERKITSPEEAAEMTRQRRIKYGLKETSNLTPEQAEKIEADIGKLMERLNMERLNKHGYNSFSLKVQEEWDWVEIEAESGKDRELAKAVLEEFLKHLDLLKEGD